MIQVSGLQGIPIGTVPLKGPGQQGQRVIPPPVPPETVPATIPHPLVTVSTIVPSPYADPGFLAQIVRAVIESMSYVSAPAAPMPQTTPVAITSTDSVVALVWTVKSMREMGCEFFLERLMLRLL